ncbi:MAG: hypothetical protein ACPLY7_00170 [Microgenomates group bacterium]
MASVERKPSLSHGEAVHRRRVLAEARREGSLARRELEIREAREKARETERRLFSEGESIKPLEKASLEIEIIWWKFKAEEISEEKRTNELEKILRSLEVSDPEVFLELTRENGEGITLLAKIRNKVIPSRIEGFYTKRRY